MKKYKIIPEKNFTFQSAIALCLMISCLLLLLFFDWSVEFTLSLKTIYPIFFGVLSVFLKLGAIINGEIVEKEEK